MHCDNQVAAKQHTGDGHQLWLMHDGLSTALMTFTIGGQAMNVFDDWDAHHVSAEIPSVHESHVCDFTRPIKPKRSKQKRAVAGKAGVVSFIHFCVLVADPAP